MFAALGVSGDLLPRMVRNHPGTSLLVLIVAILAIIGAAAITSRSANPSRYLIYPVVMLGLALIGAAAVAAHSQTIREVPSVTLSLARTEDGGLMVTSKASASSLRSDERMLTRVVALFRPLATVERPRKDARHSGKTTSELQDVAYQQCKLPRLYLADPSTARLLSWTETGPSATGASVSENSMPVPPAARYICAYVILSDDPDPSGQPKQPIANFALVDLTDLS